jgi:omega-amidase
MKLACLQMEVAKGDPGANLATVRRWAPAARDEGADLVLLPEMWATGFPYRDLPRLADETPAILAALGDIAREHSLTLAGSLPERERDLVYNTFRVVGPDGESFAAGRKAHLFPPFKEDRFLAAGKCLEVFETGGVKAGGVICFDLRFPELVRKLCLKGAVLLLVTAQWPEERLEHWEVLLRARSVENQVFTAGCNTTGKTGRTVFAGGSRIIDPSGRVLASRGAGEGLVTAELNFGEVARTRAAVDYLSCRVRDVDEFLSL